MMKFGDLNDPESGVMMLYGENKGAGGNFESGKKLRCVWRRKEATNFCGFFFYVFVLLEFAGTVDGKDPLLLLGFAIALN